MRIQAKTIVTAFVLLSLVSGAIGCRYNGAGAKYNPGSYSFYNPFKGSEAPPYRQEETAGTTQKPHLEGAPNIQEAPGGYANPGTQKYVSTQYDHLNQDPAAEHNRIASVPVYSDMSAPGNTSVYSHPETTYAPYQASDTYQPARYQLPYDQGGQPTGVQQTAPPMWSDPGNPAANPMPMNQGTVPAGYQAPTGYQAPPASDAFPVYGNPMQQPVSQPIYQPQPAYEAPTGSVPTQSYGAQPSLYENSQAIYGVPAATPATVDAMPNTVQPSPYTVNPSTYQPGVNGF